MARHGGYEYDYGDDPLELPDADDGLPGLPMAATIVFAVVITAPLWLPAAVLFAAVDQLWNKRRG